MSDEEKTVALIGPGKARNQLAAIAMLATGVGGLAAETDESEYVVRHDDRSDFVKHHEELDKVCRRGFRITNSNVPYRKPKPAVGLPIKGKQMKKWAKKARHLQMNIERDLDSK